MNTIYLYSHYITVTFCVDCRVFCVSPALCDMVGSLYTRIFSDCRSSAAHGDPTYGGHPCMLANKVHPNMKLQVDLDLL